jgi:hypothetical protein
MAMPMKRRRRSEVAIICRRGEEGCSSTMTTLQAEIMNRPRPAASMKYSGQWRTRLWRNLAGNRSCLFGAGRSFEKGSAAKTIARSLPCSDLLELLCIWDESPKCRFGDEEHSEKGVAASQSLIPVAERRVRRLCHIAGGLHDRAAGRQQSIPRRRGAQVMHFLESTG